MLYKEYEVPVRSEDGSVSSKWLYTVPELTSDELDTLLATAANYPDKTIIDVNGDVTDYGSYLLEASGLRYFRGPFLTPTPATNFSTVWESDVTAKIPGLYSITDFAISVPITSESSDRVRRGIKTYDGHNYHDGYISQLTAASYLFRTMTCTVGNNSSLAPFNTSDLPSDYGSGTGGSGDGDFYWNIYAFATIEGDSSKALSLTCAGYKGAATPLGLRCTPSVVSASSRPNFYYTIRDYFSLQEGKIVDPEVDDPYNIGGGESSTGGGTGDFNGKSDSIDIPDLPSATATDAGFITLFNPTLSQMRSLASYMWSGAFDLETFRKLFADPMDAILGLSIVPVAVPSGGAREVKVGNIGTGVSMNVATSQYVAVDCGTLNVKEYWGAYLDYEPFTKAEIYLPYIGTHPIAVDDIMGKAVHVVYHVDVLSGACVAYVKCGGSVLYNFIGQCSSSIPITGNDWTNVINGVLNIAGSIGSMVATGGLSAPAALGTVASTAVNSMKPTVEKSGAISGTGGLMGIQKPYLILTRPRQAVPKNQNKYTGYPSYINRKLSDLSGYTEVDQIHIEGVYATEQEYNELDSLIRSGVIF